MWLWGHSHITMLVYVNNNPVEIDVVDITLLDLMLRLQIPTKGVGVGVNNKLIRAAEWPLRILKDGDRLTVISASYGG